MWPQMNEHRTAILRAKAQARRGFLDEEVATLARGGMTLDELCIHYDANPPVIRRIGKRFGIEFPSKKKPSPWSAEATAVLIAGWLEGKSTATLGRELGVTKNAIVGKAGRLDLPIRENPIYPDAEGAPPRQRLPPKRPRDPTIKRERKSSKPREVLPPLPVERPRAPIRPTIVAPPPPPTPEPPVVRSGRVSECCWPVSEVGKRSFAFCDDPTEPGRPYCAKHVALAHGKKVAA